MRTIKSNWAFSVLWVNLAVAIALLFLVTLNHSLNVREFVHIAVYCLIYANLTGILGIATLNWLARKLLRKPSIIPLMVVAIFVISPLGCLLAQTLLMVIGFAVPRQFWQEYLHTLGLAMPLAIVFGLGAFVHGSLRARVQLMEERLREKEVAEARSQKLAAEARLHSLESRIHPHFLFNTLNSISSLIAVNPDRAEQIVGRLAALLRASLETSYQPLIPLREEMAMVEGYVDIEKVRFGEKLLGSVNLPVGLQDAQVPPMSVQSLVENAVKHGITPQRNGGEILVTATTENGSLRIEVRDTGPGFDLTAIRAGHGLDNLVERLDALFGAKARLNVLRRDGCSVVEMVLPLV